MLTSSLSLFKAGGVVMWPLLIFSIAACAFVIERIVFWSKINRRQGRLVKEVLGLYQHQPDIVPDKLRKNRDLPMARIFMAAVELEEPTPDEFRLALESETQAEIPLLKRFNNVFETIISLAPLLGLLGTVLGLIQSFASLNIGDVGGEKTAGVTSGISEALVSTASGLVVAIFVLMFANVFRSMYQRQIAQIQEHGGHLELLHRRHYERSLKAQGLGVRG
ncbi:MAG: MotA/TolQ/ExbB proton channel family protein [Xenococcaceae cyanobacterium]